MVSKQTNEKNNQMERVSPQSFFNNKNIYLLTKTSMISFPCTRLALSLQSNNNPFRLHSLTYPP